MCSSISQKCNSKIMERRIIFCFMALDSENIFKPNLIITYFSEVSSEVLFPFVSATQAFPHPFLMYSTNQNIFNKCIRKPEPVTFLPLPLMGNRIKYRFLLFHAAQTQIKKKSFCISFRRTLFHWEFMSSLRSVVIS